MQIGEMKRGYREIETVSLYFAHLPPIRGRDSGQHAACGSITRKPFECPVIFVSLFINT